MQNDTLSVFYVIAKTPPSFNLQENLDLAQSIQYRDLVLNRS